MTTSVKLIRLYRDERGTIIRSEEVKPLAVSEILDVAVGARMDGTDEALVEFARALERKHDIE